ncbi:MAG TPA: response regulator transcription factor [Terriglobales bacterium]|nr:response regulator transcription factor [Terriglobales bacterium]
MKQLIFVVEDETEVRELARQCLERAGYVVRTFSTANVIQEAEDNHPCLMLITMVMPDGNGLDLCQSIRENHALARTPIVFLIPEAAEEHRALALESGADDCIVKPFSPRELVARVQAVLRRFAPAAGRSRLEPADLVIDSLAMKLSVRGSEVPTTSLEFRLIEYLARHRGQVFTRDLLLDAVWGDMQFVTPRSVDACIRRIREKIEPDRTSPTYLKTIRGVGYRLDAIAAWQLAPNDGCTCLACTTPLGPSRAIPATERRRRTSSQD